MERKPAPKPLTSQKSVQKPTEKARQRREMVRVKGGIDRPFLVIVILLLCFGSVMVFSASFAYAQERYGDSYYYIKKQIMFALLGLLAMMFVIVLKYDWIKLWTPLAFMGVFVALILVLIPGIGIREGAARRWLPFFGVTTIQPSEFMKLTLILMLAWYISKFHEKIEDAHHFWKASLWGVFIPMGIIGSVCALVAFERHVSGTIILFAIGMVVILAGGAKLVWFLSFGGLGIVVVTLVVFGTNYAKARIDGWLCPTADPLGATWQTSQGLIAIGSGGFLGVGLGKSRQKHMYVSQPQNDFIFSIICEELGFVGAVAVIVLFILFIWRGYVIAMKAPDRFSSLVVLGIISKVAIQAILNIAVVTNTIPNTGISLPFFSYGGTSLILQLMEAGIVLCISRYSYQEKK